MNENSSELKNSWRLFFATLFSPLVLITAVVTLIALILAGFYSSNASVSIIFSVLASITSGVLGGIAWDKYKEKKGNDDFFKKGKSAVRNLSLIGDQLSRLSDRLIEMDHDKSPFDIDEINHHLLTTQKNVVSAIEDWVDMMPDLKAISELAESLFEQGAKYKNILEERDVLKEKINKLHKNQDTTKKELESKLEDKDNELRKIQSEITRLKSRQLTLGGSTITTSGGLAQALTKNLNLGQTRNCNECGKQYSSYGSMPAFNKCTECLLQLLKG